LKSLVPEKGGAVREHAVFTQPTEAEAIYLFWQKRHLQAGELSYSEVARCATRHGLDLGQLLEGRNWWPSHRPAPPSGCAWAGR